MLADAYTQEEALKLPFADDYYLMDGTICEFPIINFSRWFRVNKIGNIKKDTEQWDILVYFFLNGCPWLPFEMRFDQGIEFTEENKYPYWYTTHEWNMYTDREYRNNYFKEKFEKEKPDKETKAKILSDFDNEYTEFCINTRAEKWLWGDTKPQLEKVIRNNFENAKFMCKHNLTCPVPIPQWLLMGNTFQEREFHFNSLQITTLAIIAYYTAKYPSKGYFEHTGLIEAYTKATPFEVRRCLNELYKDDLVHIMFREPDTCDGAICGCSWLLNIIRIDNVLKQYNLTVGADLLNWKAKLIPMYAAKILAQKIKDGEI